MSQTHSQEPRKHIDGELIVNRWKPSTIVAKFSMLDASDGDEVLPTATNTHTSKVETVATNRSNNMPYFVKEVGLFIFLQGVRSDLGDLVFDRKSIFY